MVTPLIIPRFNWVDFSNFLRGIDASPVEFSECAQFIAALSEFRGGKEIKPLAVLRAPGDLLEHLQFSFLISGSKDLFFRLMELTELAVIFKEKEAVVTGSLDQWKKGTINCLNSVYSPSKELRRAFNDCLKCFDACGLQAIFYDYRRTWKEGTFLLESR